MTNRRNDGIDIVITTGTWVNGHEIKLANGTGSCTEHAIAEVSPALGWWLSCSTDECDWGSGSETIGGPEPYFDLVRPQT